VVRAMIPKLLFLHVPKCGGSTFDRILAKNFEHMYPLIDGSYASIERLRTLSRTDLEQYSAFAGHFFFGVHELFESPCTYVSFIRHPVQRVISNYLYVFQSKAHYLRRFVCPEGKAPMPLTEFVGSDLSLALENQTVLMFGNRGAYRPGFIEQFARDVQEGRAPHVRIPFHDNNWGEPLDRAKKNIEAHFTCVGLTERFDASLAVMQRLVPLSDVSHTIINRTISKMPDADLKAVEGIVLGRNKYDLALYEYCATRLTEQMETCKQ